VTQRYAKLETLLRGVIEGVLQVLKIGFPFQQCVTWHSSSCTAAPAWQAAAAGNSYIRANKKVKIIYCARKDI